MGWRTQTTTRVYTCRYCGDISEQLSGYSKQTDIAYCPNDGTELLIQVGGDNMTKKKLKAMHENANDAPKLREAKGHVHETKTKTKHAQEVTKTAEPDPMIEKAFEALKKLGGKATSPELVKELGFTGESKRDQVRRLMSKLHDAHRIHRTKGDKGYVFEIVEPKPEPTVEVATT